MDRSNLEPDHGLRQSFTGVQKLLCRISHENSVGYRRQSSIQEWLQTHAAFRPCRFAAPLEEGKKSFVNSMSDLFHKDIPQRFTQKVFETMNACPQHVFQILTKRSDVLVQHAPHLQWGQNIWMGVSVENKNYVYRLDDLRQTPAHIKFVSFEPLLGPIPNTNLASIDWVIVGGESGPNFQAMDPDWARDLRDQCQEQGVKFFFKQWSGIRPKSLGRLLDGILWDGMPK